MSGLVPISFFPFSQVSSIAVQLTLPPYGLQNQDARTLDGPEVLTAMLRCCLLRSRTERAHTKSYYAIR